MVLNLLDVVFEGLLQIGLLSVLCELLVVLRIPLPLARHQLLLDGIELLVLL